MKKKLVKRKKVQFGTITNPNRPRQADPNYNWMDFDETAFPSIPGAVNPINQMPITAQGTDTGEGANNIPLRSNPDGSYSFQRTEGTGVMQDSPFVTGFNALATGVTGLANTIQNNRLKNREQKQMLEANEPKYWENMEGAGLNNIPMYTQYGGKTSRKYRAGGNEPSVAKAKEMLRDGTVNGKELTEKQKAYFGWIVGGKKQVGGSTDPTELEQWNALKQKYAGSLPKVGGQGALDKRMEWTKWAKQPLPTGGTPAELAAKAAKATGFNNPGLLLSSSMEEGVGSRFKEDEGYSTAYDEANTKGELKGYPVDAFRSYGLDQIGERVDEFVKKGYLPEGFQSKMKPYRAANEIDEREYYTEAAKIAQKNNLVGKDFKFKADSTVYNQLDTSLKDYKGQLPTMKKSANTAAFVDDESAFMAKAAFMRAEQDNINNYSKKKGYTLTPQEQDFFTLASYNAGQGGGQKMLDYYGGKKLLGNDGFLKDRIPSKGQVYDNVLPRLAGSNLFNKEGYFAYTDEMKYGGELKIKKIYQSGGVPEGYHVMPDGSIMSDEEMTSEEGMYNTSNGNVEAEQGEIVEGEDGRIVKISDTAKRHEQGGVKLNNVSRVLEDTSDKRKDTASKMLKLSPEEMESLFGFRPKSSVSHSKAFELATKHYDGKRDKINRNNKLINDRTKVDKYGAKSAELNFKTLQDIPTQEDVYDALFMHQEHVKGMNNIDDDGSMSKHGGKYKKKGGKYNVRGRRVAHHKSYYKAQAGTESEGFSRPARGKGYYFDEVTQRWYAPGDVPSAAAVQQSQQAQSPSVTGITPYQGGRTSSGSTTPTGNPNQFNFPGGFDAYKSAWSPVLDLSQYNDVNEAQQATYNYLVQNQPDVAASIWQTQGLTQKGRDMMNPKSRSYDQGFARIAANIFDSTGKLKQGVNLTPEQLQALTPAYSDNMLGVRAVTPSQTTQTTGQGTPGSTQSSATASGQPLDTSANINPNFIRQPSNQFKESMYWDELAAPLMSLTEGREAELYNPVQLNQLRYKLLDPTAAMNANQADFNAVAQGLDPANTANLLGNKYAANAQIMANYDNQNTQIKNREIDYNTGVRDRQSVADASTRAVYDRSVKTSREVQRQQRLKAIEDITRAIQMKRRQNKSGNLILKMSPAFDQSGEYNGYQYAPILPTDLGISSQLPVVTPPKKTSSTKTTTTWKIGDRTIKTENKG